MDPQEAYSLDMAVDPNSSLFKDLMAKLLKPRMEVKSRADRLRHQGEWKYILPFKADAETEVAVVEQLPFRFADRGCYRNGARSLACLADAMVDLIASVSGRRRTSPALVVSAEFEMLFDTMASSESLSPLVKYCGEVNLYSQFASHRPDVVVFDHTTINVPVDELLNLAFSAGVHVVDGVFPLHVGGIRGWDVVSGFGSWSYTHYKGDVTIGPDDDATRMLKYPRAVYAKFTDPAKWVGNSRKYLYEIRKYHMGLATYRAVYVGDDAVAGAEDVTFKLPVCSSDEMVLVTVNRRLASGVFASASNNAAELTELDKDYAIEVRRDLFTSCITYLIGRERGVDMTGESIRYITQHNYVDLADGIRIVRRQSMSYADGLCVAIICALVAYDLRYRMTSEMIPVVQRSVAAARVRTDAPLGALGRLAWLLTTYVGDATRKVMARSRDAAINALYSNDFIPGICYDVYMDRHYRPHAEWFEAWTMTVEQPEVPVVNLELDPFANFMGDVERAYAPNVVKRKDELPDKVKAKLTPYQHNTIKDPAYALQEVYDQLLPGNSTAQIQNVAEMRRVNDINVNTEFHGKIEINKDIAAPEVLHRDAPLRTSALPVSRTPLVDAILASAKRNWNPPDMQMQNNVWSYARKLVDDFIDFAFMPSFRKTIGIAYKNDPIQFNVTDYMAWRAGKDQNYRKVLDEQCVGDLVELELERYDTIVKKRVKPKLNVSAQHEIGQGQVIVGMPKKETALFTSLFRVIFERFDGALRPEICSAGRMSDDDISDWVTSVLPVVKGLKAVELDSSKYDKSQNLLARMIEALLFIELGLDPVVMDIFEDSYVGRVSSKSVGLMFISAYQMKSGAPNTMLGNIAYNAVSASESLGRENIVAMIVKGDDNVAWLRGGTDHVLAVHKMANLFNLEAKMVTGSVLYFSSGYILVFEEFAVFAPDIVKVIELLGEKGMDPRTRFERYTSFRDRVSAYAKDVAVPPTLRDVVRRRMDRPDADIVLAVDALLTIAGDYSVYESVVDS